MKYTIDEDAGVLLVEMDNSKKYSIALSENNNNNSKIDVRSESGGSILVGLGICMIFGGFGLFLIAEWFGYLWYTGVVLGVSGGLFLLIDYLRDKYGKTTRHVKKQIAPFYHLEKQCRYTRKSLQKEKILYKKLSKLLVNRQTTNNLLTDERLLHSLDISTLSKRAEEMPLTLETTKKACKIRVERLELTLFLLNIELLKLHEGQALQEFKKSETVNEGLFAFEELELMSLKEQLDLKESLIEAERILDGYIKLGN